MAPTPTGAPNEPAPNTTSAGRSIGAFYEADPRRRESDEVEYGDGWTRHDDPRATYRVSHVLATGELYTVREPHPGGILARYLDQLNVEQADVDELTVDVLAVLSPQDADRRLEGWPAAMTGTDSLAWVRRQLAAS
jgi:hypothetical protein